MLFTPPIVVHGPMQTLLVTKTKDSFFLYLAHLNNKRKLCLQTDDYLPHKDSKGYIFKDYTTNLTVCSKSCNPVWRTTAVLFRSYNSTATGTHKGESALNASINYNKDKIVIIIIELIHGGKTKEMFH